MRFDLIMSAYQCKTSIRTRIRVCPHNATQVSDVLEPFGFFHRPLRGFPDGFPVFLPVQASDTHALARLPTCAHTLPTHTHLPTNSHSPP